MAKGERAVNGPRFCSKCRVSKRWHKAIRKWLCYFCESDRRKLEDPQ